MSMAVLREGDWLQALLQVIDQTHAAEAFDASGKRANGERVSRERDGNVVDGLLAEVMEVDGCVEHGRHDRRVARDAGREEVRRGLGVAYLVGGDEGEQFGEYRIRRMLADAPEEVRREVLGEQ